MSDSEETERKKHKGNEEEEENAEVLSDHDEEIEQIDETQYGIKQRIGQSLTRFSGVYKASASDFVVNEIDLDKNVVRLTTYDLPPGPDTPPAQPENASQQSDTDMVNLLGQETFDQLKTYLQSKDLQETYKLEAPKNKPDRKIIHDFIKSQYKNFHTNTIQESNEKQIIEICPNNSKVANSSRNCFKQNRNSARDQYLSSFKCCDAVLYKENIDTIKAVNLIAKHLRINVKRIGFAGTKDKVAKTSQLLSFFKIEPKQLARLNNNFHNIKLGNFKLSNKEGYRLGDLYGNRFKIVIRRIDAQTPDESIRNTVDAFSQNGFINYFGLQRFGTCVEAPTHSVAQEKEEVKIARDIWAKDNAKAYDAYLHIERINCIEKYLLNGLSQCSPNDYLGALNFIPRSMRLMYLHAYQSYIWNEVVSKRIELYGLKLCVGDLVLPKDKAKRGKNEQINIVRVTEENRDQYSIEDVVLPLPGYNVHYPSNQIGDYYKELLARDELQLESLKNKVKDFSLSGDYRHIVTKPEDLCYQIKSYTSEDEKLVKSDLDLMENSQQETETSSIGRYKAICLEYTLPSSCYATISLREILKS